MEEPVHLTIDGQLEIDGTRGVIYFHLNNDKDINKYNLITLLRICNLPKIHIQDLKTLLDITHMKGCSWQLERR